MFYKILILISCSIYFILPIKVFGLEPTSGIVCYALKKKQKTTKIEREKAKARAKQGRIIRSELKELETWFIDHGYLKKN